MPFTPRALLILPVFLCLVLSPLDRTFASALKTSGIGYLLADSRGKIMVSKNPDQQFIAASTFKVLTALGALNTLGKDYRFRTEFFMGHIGQENILKIKGYGDPFLTSEILETTCHELALILLKKGISTIKAIEIDNGFFEPDIEIPGTGNSTNPYDAGVNALSANFNTVAFRFSKELGQYISGEPQTPLVNFARDTKKRILASGLDRGRLVLSRAESRTYAGLLIKFFLEKEQIIIRKGVTEGQITDKDEKIHTHVSPYTLEELVQRVLQYSNNFMANQIFLASGADSLLPPASLEKSIKTLDTYADKTLGIQGVSMAEGSGISRKNKISPRQMLKVLMAFKNHHTLMNHEKNEYYKTGTLNGIRTRVGYFQKKDKGLFPYVIMVNQKGTGYEEIKAKLKKVLR